MSDLFFASDNGSGIHPEVLHAIASVNGGYATAYGDDEVTTKAISMLRDAFSPKAEILFTFNGTGANVLAVGSAARSFEAVFCADCSHLNADECGAPEKFFGGKLIPVTSDLGKVTVDAIESALGENRGVHHARPRVVSITQPTEWGTIYTADEIAQIAEFAHARGMVLHMDGARLSNAAARLEVSFREITTDVGVDIVSFGGTKNGLMGAEAVVFINSSLAENAGYLRKQATQLGSKMRFISAQFIALMTDELWRRNATHANLMAARLADGIANLSLITLTCPVEINALFPQLDARLVAPLQSQCAFYMWDERMCIARWMTSFDTSERDVDAFAQIIQEADERYRTSA